MENIEKIIFLSIITFSFFYTFYFLIKGWGVGTRPFIWISPKKTKLINRLSLLFLTTGLLTIGLLLFIQLRKPNKLAKIVLIDENNQTYLISKPWFISEVSYSNNDIYLSSPEADFHIYTEGATEPRYPLCKIVYDDPDGMGSSDCSTTVQKYGNNTVVIIQKTVAGNKKVASLRIKLPAMQHGIQINKNNQSTQADEYFTDTEVDQWFNAISTW